MKAALKKNTKKLLNVISPKLNVYLKLNHYKGMNENFPATFNSGNAEQDGILSEVLENGYYVLPDFFDAKWCQDCVDEFDIMVKDHPEFVRSREDERIFNSQNISDNFMTFYKHPVLQGYSDNYYGEDSVVGVMLTNYVDDRNGADLGSGGDWHRDRMTRQIKAIVYLKDVEEGNGAFQYIAQSNMHNFDNFKKDSFLMGFGDQPHRMSHQDVQKIIDKQPERLKTFTAKRGTVILVDTSGIHRGSPVQKGHRYASFNYYMPKSEYDPEATQKKFSPLVPEDFQL